MNQMSRAGVKVAQSLARMYASNQKVRAVLVGGSVSRGYADEYSDLEIGVFWETPPDDIERKNAALRMGGEIWKFDPGSEERASEHIGLSELTLGSKRYTGTAMVSPIHLTVETADVWIAALIDSLDTSPQKCEFASAIRYGIPLYGCNLVQRWKKKVTRFPDRLAIKLVQQNMWMGPWFNWSAYTTRTDHLVMAQHLVWMQQSIVNMLAALNREFVFSKEYKWLDQFLDRLHIKPDNCAKRLRATFETRDRVRAVREIVEVGMEVLDLIALHLPEVNEVSLVEGHPEINTCWAKQRWTPSPPYTLLDAVAQDVVHEGQPS